MRLVGTITDLFGRVFKIGQPYLKAPSDAAQIQEDPASTRWKQTVKMEKQPDGTMKLSTPLVPGDAADLCSAYYYLEGQEQKKKYIKGLRWVMEKYR